MQSIKVGLRMRGINKMRVRAKEIKRSLIPGGNPPAGEGRWRRGITREKGCKEEENKQRGESEA